MFPRHRLSLFLRLELMKPTLILVQEKKSKENNLDLPQTMPDVPVIGSDWCAFEQVSEDVTTTEQKRLLHYMHYAKYSLSLYNTGYLIYCQSHAFHHHVVNRINIFLDDGCCRTSRPWFIFKILSSSPKFSFTFFALLIISKPCQYECHLEQDPFFCMHLKTPRC